MSNWRLSTLNGPGPGWSPDGEEEWQGGFREVPSQLCLSLGSSYLLSLTADHVSLLCRIRYFHPCSLQFQDETSPSFSVNLLSELSGTGLCVSQTNHCGPATGVMATIG